MIGGLQMTPILGRMRLVDVPIGGIRMLIHVVAMILVSTLFIMRHLMLMLTMMMMFHFSKRVFG